MKKRFFSVSVACIMAVSSFATAFATPKYEIPVMEAPEIILTSMDNDATASTPTDALNLRKLQQEAMESVNAVFYAPGAFTDSAEWDAYVNKVFAYDTAYETDVNKYMKMRFFKEKYPTDIPKLTAALTKLDQDYDTTNQTLKESSDTFDTYITKSWELYTLYAGDITTKMSGKDAEYNAFKRQSLLDSTKNLLGLIFSSKGVGADSSAYDYSFLTEFMKDDIRKKEIALFFGKALTKELAYGDLFDNIKSYMSRNLASLRTDMDKIFVEPSDSSIKSSYDFFGKVLTGAYAGNAVVLADVNKLAGDGTAEGALELAMKKLDPTYKLQNIWLNLGLRQYVQMENASGGEFTTVEKGKLTTGDKIRTGETSVNFAVSGLADYGFAGSNAKLPTSYFNVIAYNADGTKNADVTYNAGKLTVSSEAVFPIYLTVHRSNAAVGGGNYGSLETYVESYYVEKRRSGGGGGGSRLPSNNIPVEMKPETGGIIEGHSSVSKGTTTDYVITPQPGFAVDKVFVNGVEVKEFRKDGNKVIITLSDIQEKQLITAEFVKLLMDDKHISYIIGYPDGEFKPQNNINREEAATIFFRLLTSDAREKFLTKDNNYSDVENERWSNHAISTLSKVGVITGYPDGTFLPGNKITRAEFATIVYRFYNMTYSGADKFEDIKDHWAKDYINAMAEKKWIEGYPDGSFKPEQAITRAEAVTMVNRMLSRLVKTENIAEGAITFSDCEKSDWFYNAVIESANTHEYEEERLEDGSEKWTKVIESPDWIKYEK